jgi:hypothetical protein
LNASASASYGPASVSVDASIEQSAVMKRFTSSLSEMTRDHEFTWESKEKQEVEVGAGDKLFFYQRCFEGPGVSTMLEYTSVSSDPTLASKKEEIYMTVRSRSQLFVKDIDVVYGDHESQCPEDRVREHTGQSADMNHDMKGK